MSYRLLCLAPLFFAVLAAQDTAGDKDKKPEPPKEKAFAEVIKGAHAIPGFFTVYRVEERAYLEIKPDQFERPFMFSITCESGLGERGFYAAQMCGETPVAFHRSGKSVQLVARSPIFTAAAGSAIRRAVDRSFAVSVLAAAKIEGQPHPERKSVLVDLNALLLIDIPMVAYELEVRYRIPYRLDKGNSSLGKIRGFEHNVEIEAFGNYMVDKPPAPPQTSPGGSAPPRTPWPSTVADVRSMVFQFRYSLSELRDTGYKPRIADDRVGHFFTQIEDYTTDRAHTPTHRYIQRWQLEKADPQAALSRPKQPIVYWLENTIPVQYRDAVREGVLMWNSAFERIGFKDAIEVKQQADDAEWDAADVRYSTIRWFINTDTGFAIGPSRANPFTGQIFDADIGFSENFTRYMRREIRASLQTLAMPWETEPEAPFVAPWSVNRQSKFCTLGEGTAREAQFASDVMLARGVDPDGPEAEELIKAHLREVVAHEVGHTLGLRHNFAASTIHTLEQNQDRALTAREGISGSVMDYVPTNLARKGATQGEYFQKVLGPYDYWAIEYAYKPIDAATPEDELPELRKIAARAAEPLLAFATDEDAGFGSTPYDMDPLVNRFDLGSDPLRYAELRVELGQEVLASVEKKLEKPGEGYQMLRYAFAASFGNMGDNLIAAAKYVGGIRQYRSHVGDPEAHKPFEPVPATQQKAALEILRKHVFAPDAFRFSPELLTKLASERYSDYFRPNGPRGAAAFDVPVHAMVLSLQRAILNRVLHPVVLSRMLDSEAVAAKPAPLGIGELFQGLQDSIWAEVGGGVSINSYRRALQREHLKRMTALVLRDASVPDDARTMARYQLTELQGRLRAAMGKGKMPLETRAHFSECLAEIEESLKATVSRTAF